MGLGEGGRKRATLCGTSSAPHPTRTLQTVSQYCLPTVLRRSVVQSKRQSHRSKKGPNDAKSDDLPRREQFNERNRPAKRSDWLVTSRSSRCPQQGMKSADIASQVGMAERTVRQWLTRGSIPHTLPRRERARLIDPYKTYLYERWNQ